MHGFITSRNESAYPIVLLLTVTALHCNRFVHYLIVTHTKSLSSLKVRELYKLSGKIIIIKIIIKYIVFGVQNAEMIPLETGAT
jgi:hypothetical protein